MLYGYTFAVTAKLINSPEEERRGSSSQPKAPMWATCAGSSLSGGKSAHSSSRSRLGHLRGQKRGFLTQVSCGLSPCLKLSHVTSRSLRKELLIVTKWERPTGTVSQSKLARLADGRG